MSLFETTLENRAFVDEKFHFQAFPKTHAFFRRKKSKKPFLNFLPNELIFVLQSF
jgi:predicted RNA-binding protein